MDLPKDIIFTIGLKLDLPDILSLCRTCKKINDGICNNRYFWIARLRQDYNIDYLSVKPINPKNTINFIKIMAISLNFYNLKERRWEVI